MAKFLVGFLGEPNFLANNLYIVHIGIRRMEGEEEEEELVKIVIQMMTPMMKIPRK